MSLSCEKVRDLIPLFPHDLEDAETSSVREHIAGCDACAAEVAIYAAQATRFVMLRTDRPKVDLYSGIQAKLARPEGRVIAFPRRGLVAAAAAAAVILGFFALSQAPKESKKDESPVAIKTPTPKAPSAPQVAHDPTPRMRSPRRRIFEAEGAQPMLPGGAGVMNAGGEVELVPFDEEAEIPGARKRTYAEPTPAHPTAPKTDDDRSLSF